jgi:hypothetical protein
MGLYDGSRSAHVEYYRLQQIFWFLFKLNIISREELLGKDARNGSEEYQSVVRLICLLLELKVLSAGRCWYRYYNRRR